MVLALVMVEADRHRHEVAAQNICWLMGYTRLGNPRLLDRGVIVDMRHSGARERRLHWVAATSMRIRSPVPCWRSVGSPAVSVVASVRIGAACVHPLPLAASPEIQREVNDAGAGRRLRLANLGAQCVTRTTTSRAPECTVELRERCVDGVRFRRPHEIQYRAGAATRRRGRLWV